MDLSKIIKFERQNKSFQSMAYSIPTIQRPLDATVVDQICARETQYYATHNTYMLAGTISIAIVAQCEFIVDGQHRMSAYKKLSLDFPERELVINVDYYTFADQASFE